MGRIKAKLEQDLTVLQVVKDLAAHTGDSEAEVSTYIAKLIDADFSAGRLQFFCKAPSAIKGARVGTLRKVQVHAGAVSTRLQEAARSGLQHVRRFKHADGKSGIDGIFIEKDALISALQSDGLQPPSAWIGVADASDEPMTSAAIVKTFTALTAAQWRNLFHRNRAVRKCRLPTKEGRRVLYSRRSIERWLITNGKYNEAGISELRYGKLNQATAKKEGLSVRTHRTR